MNYSRDQKKYSRLTQKINSTADWTEFKISRLPKSWIRLEIISYNSMNKYFHELCAIKKAITQIRCIR